MAYTFWAGCLLAAAFCAFAEGGVVKVAINDGHPNKEAASIAKKEAGKGADEVKVEGGSFCHNILCPNSTVCREVNKECQVCGFDQRCHSGSVCNNRCETNDQCGGECPSCEGNRCKAGQKCSNILCNSDWDCRGNGECSQCGLDGVCHTDSSICGVACNTYRDCGGECSACYLGQCTRSAPVPYRAPRYWPEPEPVPYYWPEPAPYYWRPVPMPEAPKAPEAPYPAPAPYWGGAKKGTQDAAAHKEEQKEGEAQQEKQEEQK